MKKCPECGKINEKEEEICSSCGYLFNGSEPDAEIKYCPECWEIFDISAKVCTKCGYPFSEDNCDNITYDEYEKKLFEAERQAEEQEKKALQAEKQLEIMRKEREGEAIAGKKKLDEIEIKKRIAAANEKAKAAEKRFYAAEQEMSGKEEKKASEAGQEHGNNDQGPIEDAETPEQTSKKNPNRVKAASIGGLLVLAIVIVAFLALRGTPVESISLEYSSATIELGITGKINYLIIPNDATNKEVKWKSSDESIASIDKKGNITGKKEGTCEITVETKNGKRSTCTISVIPAGPDLQSLYYSYCESSYATVAPDGSYLMIDTNPYDIDDYNNDSAIQAILDINAALNIPDSVAQKMSSTRAIDGIQSQTCGDIEVSWSFHPQNGLEVLYSLN